MYSKSFWEETKIRPCARYFKHEKCDVAVVGGGITGMVTAYFLSKQNIKVCLLERNRIGGGDTSNTTAHLTYVTDTLITELKNNFGEQNARLIWQGGQLAIDLIEDIVLSEEIDCDFKRVPLYLSAPLFENNRDDERVLQEEAEIASRLGFDCEFKLEIPYFKKAGVGFADQAKFNPLKFLAGLRERIEERGGLIFENSEVKKFEEKPLALNVNDKRLECGHVIIATHVPLMGNKSLLPATFFQTKIAPYSSYVIGAKIPCGVLPQALICDISDPYYYVRVENLEHSDYVIFGGYDHKTGQEVETDLVFKKLQARLLEIIPEAVPNRRWSGQVIESNDGLPYIGENAKDQFIAGGFAGNGMTFGVLAAQMAQDYIDYKKNPWENIFSVSRMNIKAGASEYIKENIDYPIYLIKDYLKAPDEGGPADLKKGEGKILKIQGKKVACYRNNDGEITQLSPVCSHMGCLVRWNKAESTWDCPCHGSRFNPDGGVIAGPAEEDLKNVSEL